MRVAVTRMYGSVPALEVQDVSTTRSRGKLYSVETLLIIRWCIKNRLEDESVYFSVLKGFCISSSGLKAGQVGLARRGLLFFFQCVHKLVCRGLHSESVAVCDFRD